MHTREIVGVMAYALKLFYTVVAAHIPPYVMGVTYHNLGNGGSPATAANNCYFSTIKHV